MNRRVLSKWSLLSFSVLFLAYVSWVVNFEVNLGRNQPMGGNSIVIATFNDENERHERVLSLRKINGENYVAANHWPRAWYREALANPSVEVNLESGQGGYIAVPVEGAEHDLVNADNSLGLMFRILTGFPPRYFLRLDPAG